MSAITSVAAPRGQPNGVVPPSPSPLWPQPLPVVGVTGEFESGKTVFLLTIVPPSITPCPPGSEPTLYFDTEKSGQTYTNDSLRAVLHFKRVCVWEEMIRLHPEGYKPIDIFTWWWEQVKKIPVGKYRVVALDCASEIESGLVDWVSKNPGYFGHSAGQYAKMDALMWGDVKELWKAILSDLASRCETFAFAVHMADVWSKQTKAPTGKRKPKGKETLMELASLYLRVERPVNARGEKPDKPAAEVIKSRLLSAAVKPETGEIDLVPTLPARLPVATPAAIRQYMLNPAGARPATEEERVRPETMTEEEKLRIQATIAEAQCQTEQLRLDQLQRQAEARAAQAATKQPAKRSPGTPAAPAKNGKPTVASLPPPPASAPGVSEEQTAALADLLTELGITPGPEWREWLAPYNAQTLGQLTHAQAADLITRLKRQSLGTHLENPSDPAYRPQPTLLADQTARLIDLKGQLEDLGLTAAEWKSWLAAFEVDSAAKLSEEQATTFENQLHAELTRREAAATAAKKSGSG